MVLLSHYVDNNDTITAICNSMSYEQNDNRSK